MEKNLIREYTFGLMLGDWLENNGMSQAELAKEISVQPHTISRIRRDIHFPNRMTFNAIVNVLAPKDETRTKWVETQRLTYESMKKENDKKWRTKK